MSNLPTLDSELQALLLAKFGTSWQVVGTDVYGSVDSFDGSQYLQNAIPVFLGSLGTPELLDTIRGFGKH